VGDGRFLALAAALCFALAAGLQQRGVFRLAREGKPVRDAKDILRLLLVWVWLLGTTVLLAGYVIQGFALSVGKVVIVQPLLVTTLVFALPLGHWLTGQHVTRGQILGAVVVVAGLGMFIRIGDPDAGIDSAPGWQPALAIVVVGGISAALLFVGRRLSPAHKAAVYGAVAGMLFGLSATFDKPAFNSDQSGGIAHLLTEWELYALVGLGVIAFAVQQLSLATGQLAPAIAAVSVANPFVATIIGAAIYQERLTPPGWHRVLAVGALLVAFAGAVVVTYANREKALPGETNGVPAGSTS
jgi:drug/metabolite transporter (DMT)-like permease